MNNLEIEIRNLKNENTFLKKQLQTVRGERDSASSTARKAIVNHVRQVAINNMLWDIVDFTLYNKPFIIEIPEKETEDERQIRILKENITKGSLAKVDPM
jgi:hypothetical protein